MVWFAIPCFVKIVSSWRHSFGERGKPLDSALAKAIAAALNFDRYGLEWTAFYECLGCRRLRYDVGDGKQKAPCGGGV